MRRIRFSFPSSQAWLMAAVLAQLGVACLVVVRIEAPLVENQARAARVSLEGLDYPWLVLTLSARLALYLLPFSLLSWAVLRRGRCWLASILFTVGSVGVLFWVSTYGLIYELTGNPLSVYVPFLLRVDQWKWGGDLGPVLMAAGGELAAVSVSLWGLMGVGLLVANRIVPRPAWRGRTVAAGIAALLVVLVGLALPMQYGISNPAVMHLGRGVLPFTGLMLDREYPYPPKVEAFRQRFEALTAEHRLRLGTYLAGLRGYGPPPTLGVAQRRNVVLIPCESLRVEALNPITMPRLYALAQRSIWMKNHYAGGNASHLGIYSLLSGRIPLRYAQTVRSGYTAFAPDVFNANGYETGYYSCGQIKDFELMDLFVEAPPFDHSRIADVGDTDDWSVGDLNAVREIRLAMRAEPDRPKFLVGFMIATHAPHFYPEAYADLDTELGASPETMFAGVEPLTDLMIRYRRSLRFMDDLVAGLIESLDDGQTVFVVTADHGESFGEDGTQFHTSRASEVQMRVPMLIYDPQASPQVIEARTQHADVMPTVLGLLTGGPVAVAGLQGRDVLHERVPEADDAVLQRPMFVMAPSDFDRRVSEPLNLVWKSGSLQLKVTASAPSKHQFAWSRLKIELMGWADQRGQFYRDLVPPDGDADRWAEVFNHTVDRMMRHGLPVGGADVPGRPATED